VNDTERDLWRRLDAFELDSGGGAKAFSARLAREQGWSAEFTRRAIAEYKRFLLLAATGEEPSTPSEIVDKVWHLHLIYSRSYWETLCRDILGKPLHHDPGTGDPGEDRAFAARYRATRMRYPSVFGHEPPRDIWPCGTTPRRTGKRYAREMLAAAIVLLASGCAAVGIRGDGVSDIELAIFFVLLFVGIVAIVVRLVRGPKPRKGGYCFGSGAGCGGGGATCGGTCGGGCGGGD
jgi:hypothetical protein